MRAITSTKPEIGRAGGALHALLRQLIAAGRPYHVSVPSVARPVNGEVEPGVAQTDLSVGATGHRAGVRIALPVIGPETDRAGRAPGPVATAGTPVDRRLDHAGKPPTPTRRPHPRLDCGSHSIGTRTDLPDGARSTPHQIPPPRSAFPSCSAPVHRLTQAGTDTTPRAARPRSTGAPTARAGRRDG